MGFLAVQSRAVGVETTAPDPLRPVLERMAAGDDSALGALYDATCRRVYGLTLHVLGDPATAEEAALDAYTQVWRQAKRFDPSRGSVTVWLLTIARSRATDLLRARNRDAGRRTSLEVARDLTSPEAGPEESSRDNERARRLRKAMEVLPAGQRQAINAAFFIGLSHTEIAQALGQPLGTVKTRIRSGLAALRDALASEAEYLG